MIRKIILSFFSAFLLVVFVSSQALAATFTAGMAKRNAPGPFSVAPIFQGDPNNLDSLTDDVVSFPQGTQISGNFYGNMDTSQGSVVLWWTPEYGYDALSGTGDHFIWYINSNYFLSYEYDNDRYNLTIGSQSMTVSSNIVAGTTYNLVARWDTRNVIQGTNYASLSIDDSHSYGITTQPTASAPAAAIYVGSDGATGGASGIIEGLTVYRRPLYDGTNGINAGNGDEINLISAGSDTDPTKITGSWDIMFALPTNQSVGSLATGNGNAWSHPYASNLIYTSTTNTGGYMLNGTLADDSWGLLPSNVPLSTDGDSLDFDGTADFLKASPNLSSANKITIEFWMKWDSFADNDDLAMEYSDNYNLYTDAFIINPNDSSTSKFFVGVVCAAGYNSSEFVRPADNGWHHYAFVIDRTAAAAGVIVPYLDGVAVSYTKTLSAACSGNFGNYALSFMSRNGASLFGAGNLDDVRIWNTTRSAAQILANKDKELTGSEANLVAYWKMNDGSGQTTADSTSSGYTATLGATTDPGADDPTWSTTAPLPPQPLATTEKIFAGGYKFVSDAANQGIYRDVTVSAGDDFVVRGVANSDGTCVPKLILYDQSNGAEIGSLAGTSASTRASPNVLIFTGQAPAGDTNLRIKLINTAASGTCYFHQVELLTNGWDDPSVVLGTAPTDVGTPTTSASSTDQAHTETHSWKVVSDAADEGIKRSITTTSGNFYAMGGWIYADTSGTVDEAVPNFQDGVTTAITSSGNDAWKHLVGINRASAATSDLQFLSNGSQTFYVDDIYSFGLSNVSLTVTPASEANSTENTDEIRVDGRDTYIEADQSSISTTGGFVSFNWRPRHSAADSVKFAETTSSDAYIISLKGDANDYIRVYFDSANTIVMSYNMNGTTGSDTWNATGAISANTEYAASISYTGGGTMVFSVGGTARITLSSIPSAFGTAPDDIYIGSDTDGANQGDATFSSFTYDSSSPSISLTAFPTDPTTDSTPTLTGTATEAIGTVSTVQFQMDSTSGSWSSCVADDGAFDEDSEAFSCTPSALSDGSHTMYVRATDSNGNTTVSGSYSSDTFTVDTTPPNSFSIESPNNSYVKDERPNFKFRAAAIPDVTSGVAKYKLEVDNGDTGDFSIDDIPASGTSDFVKDKYTVHFEGFGDSDTGNNHIQIQTKTSSDWGSSTNDGKVKEGKRRLKITAVDQAGNEKEESVDFFVDKSSPGFSISNVNGEPFALELITTSHNLKIAGRAIDSLSGDKSENRVASGIEKIDLLIEKKGGFGLYSPLITSSLNITDNYFENTGKKIDDNSKNTGNKYASFTFSPSHFLALGEYRVTISANDKAGNGSATSFNISVLPFAQVIPEEEIPIKKSVKKKIVKKTPKLVEKPKEKKKIVKKEEEKIEITKEKIQERKKEGFVLKIPNPVPIVVSATRNIYAKAKDVGSFFLKNSVLVKNSFVNFVSNLIPRGAKVKGVMIAEKYLDPDPLRIEKVKIKNVTRTSFEVYWTTNQYTYNNKVNFGQTKSFGKSLWSKNYSKQHFVKVTKLKPDAIYYFEVMSQGKNYTYDAVYEVRTKE